MKFEKVMDVGTSHPVVARLGLGMFEIIDFSHLEAATKQDLKEFMLEAMQLLVKAERIGKPILDEIEAQVKTLGPTGIKEDEKGLPIFTLRCSILPDTKLFFKACDEILRLTLKTVNVLWSSHFSLASITEMRQFTEEHFGKDHVVSKLLTDDQPWLLDLVRLINFSKGDGFGFTDFQLSEKDESGKYHLTLPSLLNGTVISNSIEVYSHNLFTFFEEITAFSLLPFLDSRLVIVEIPEANRDKDLALRFKIGLKPGTDLESFKGDSRFQKIYRSGQQRFHERETMRQSKFGRVRPIISSPIKGKMTVVVRNTVYSGNWVTFTDFLYDYLKIKFGRDWWLAEIKKSKLTCSPVINWARRLQDHQKAAGVLDGILSSVSPNGPMNAYYSLAYDMFILEDNSALQASLLERMRKPDKHDFWGARYEAMVASTLLKAGFDLEFENEADNRATHPEFIATNRYTGEQIDVEAKKRNRASVPEVEEEIRLNIADLLKSAMKKSRGRPFVVFLELDLPPIDGDPLKKPWFGELLDSIDESGIRGPDGKDVCNLIVFTNYPTDNPAAGAEFPTQSYIVSQTNVPKIPFQNPIHMAEIVSAVNLRNSIPTWFEE